MAVHYNLVPMSITLCVAIAACGAAQQAPCPAQIQCPAVEKPVEVPLPVVPTPPAAAGTSTATPYLTPVDASSPVHGVTQTVGIALACSHGHDGAHAASNLGSVAA